MTKIEQLEKENAILRNLNSVYSKEIEALKQLVDLYSNTDDSSSRMVNSSSSMVDNSSHTVDTHAHPVNTSSNPVDISSHPVDTHAHPVDTHTHPVDISNQILISSDKLKVSPDQLQTSSTKLILSSDMARVLKLRLMSIIEDHVGIIKVRKLRTRLSDELIYIGTNDNCSLKNVISHFRLSKPTWMRDSALLRKGGLLRYEGTKKNGCYFLTDKGRKLLKM